MRLFTALDLPPEILQKLAELLAQLSPEAELKWSPLANLHITTKFIGEWPETRVDELDEALKGLCGSQPIHIELGGLGWFPNTHSPRVLWVGVNGPAGSPCESGRVAGG
jgi:2'-5' RNA ligase